MAWVQKKPQLYYFHSNQRGEVQTGLIVFFLLKNMLYEKLPGVQKIATAALFPFLSQRRTTDRSPEKGNLYQRLWRKYNFFPLKKNYPKKMATG